jgi:putative redox protein
MIRIDVEYEGDLRCRAVHAPSGRVLQTDAPRDNHGRGESFSPTDTLATALLTCMMTVMGILAQKSGWSLAGMSGSVEKHMTALPPRRVAKLVVAVALPASTAALLDADAKKALVQAGETCPVRLSLSDLVDVQTRYDFGEG